MVPLHGVLPENYPQIADLKQKFLLFDRFHMARLPLHATLQYLCGDEYSANTLQFLMEKNLISDLGTGLRVFGGNQGMLEELERLKSDIEYAVETKSLGDVNRQAAFKAFQAFDVRQTCLAFNKTGKITAVPLDNLVPDYRTLAALELGSTMSVDGISVAIEQFPVPDDSNPWEDVFEFKQESRDKLWHLRRFLSDLATKRQTEAEIRDDIAWSLHQYTKEMDRLKIKKSIRFMETYIIPAVEAFEHLKPTAFLKGIVATKKRKLELLESEANTPGRECAYVFEAQKRFS